MTNIKKQVVARYVAPALTGVLLTLCQPTGFKVDFGALAWVSLAPLLVSVRGMKPIDRFRSGFIAGFVHFLTGLYWLMYTLNTFGNLNMASSLFVALLLVVGESAYIILFTLAWGWVEENRPGVPMALAVSVVWVAIEFLRNKTPFGGFPWMLLGYSQGNFPSVIQIADITGVYGVSFLIALVNAVIAEAILAKRSGKPLPLPGMVVAVLLLMLTVIYGRLQIARVSALAAKSASLKVSLLQGNIRQDVKWDEHEEARILGIYRRMTEEAARNGAELIVWPEAAVPFALVRDVEGVQLAMFLMSLNTYIVLGSVDYTVGADQRARFTNSAFLVTPRGVEGKYSKLHLVPFSEYVPFASWFKFIDKITKGAAGNFTPGGEIALLEIPKGHLGILICYEAIFGELVRLSRKNGANLLVNITNDAWFGDTSAPRQHLSMSAFRCAENHCYMVRAANTGISAVVDPTGKVLMETGLLEEKRLDATVRIMPGSTFYSRHGDVFVGMVSMLALAGLLFEIITKIRDKVREKKS